MPDDTDRWTIDLDEVQLVVRLHIDGMAIELDDTEAEGLARELERAAHRLRVVLEQTPVPADTPT